MKIINQNNNSISVAKTSINTKQRSSRLDQIISALPFSFNNKPVIAVMRLEGVIGKTSPMKSGLNISSLNNLIEKIFKIDRLEAVCLCINSPGGSPVQSELIAKRLTNLAQEANVPIYSFVEDVAASGGYWLACAGEEIFASKSSIIGSIGVVSSGFGFHGVIDKLGIERRVITEGKNKSVLDPFQPTKSSDVKLLKSLQKKIYEHFVENVRKSRKGRITQNDDIVFNGEFWTGQTALDYGLIDGIDDLYSFINKRYGSEVKIERIENKQSWFKRKLGLASSADNFQDVMETVISSVEEKLITSKFDLY